MLRNVKLVNHVHDLSRHDRRTDSQTVRHMLTYCGGLARILYLGLEPPASPKKVRVCAHSALCNIYIYIYRKTVPQTHTSGWRDFPSDAWCKIMCEMCFLQKSSMHICGTEWVAHTEGLVQLARAGRPCASQSLALTLRCALSKRSWCCPPRATLGFRQARAESLCSMVYYGGGIPSHP